MALFLVVALPCASAEENPWAALATPAPGPARAVGGYSAGCLIGGEALPLTGDGWRIMAPQRGRLYGHPQLVAAIRALASAARAEHLGLLGVGDLGQPRGGPAPSGHASHQSGLDVDLWYVVGGTRRKPSAPSLVDGKTLEPTRYLGAKVVRLLELAATDERVARLFVHPSIKRALCSRFPTPESRAWLHKVRPWWGHDHHFHLRLACPADSPECVPQEEIAPGDGCEEMTFWFSEATSEERDKQRAEYKKRVGARPPLPETCQALVAP